MEKLDIHDGLAAGTDLWAQFPLPEPGYMRGYDSNPTFMNLLRNACKDILYTVANSNAMNGISAETQVVNSMPTWQKLLIAVDCVVGVILIAVAAWAYISYMKKNVLIYKDVDNTMTVDEKKKER